jgi:hypothetical protein
MGEKRREMRRERMGEGGYVTSKKKKESRKGRKGRGHHAIIIVDIGTS